MYQLVQRKHMIAIFCKILQYADYDFFANYGFFLISRKLLIF